MKLQCWKCGVELQEILFPFSRYEECSVCKADQHVCLMCKEYDPGVADACREDRAEYVLDKDKANFCDFFKPQPGAYQKKDDSQAKEARSKLAELFGEATEAEDSKQESSQDSEADRALAKLKRLFGDE